MIPPLPLQLLLLLLTAVAAASVGRATGGSAALPQHCWRVLMCWKLNDWQSVDADLVQSTVSLADSRPYNGPTHIYTKRAHRPERDWADGKTRRKTRWQRKSEFQTSVTEFVKPSRGDAALLIWVWRLERFRREDGPSV